MKVYIVVTTGFEGIDALKGAFFSKANADTFLKECKKLSQWEEYCSYEIEEIEMMDTLNPTGGTKYYAGIYYPTD